MNKPKPEIRSLNNTRSPEPKPGVPTTRSVLECGGSSPLSRCRGRSADKPAQSRRFASVFACLLAAFCIPLSAFAQFSIDWFTVDGGGGTSTGGVYSVSGTIGQPDAGGPMTGGAYSLTGGFWALPSVIQTPSAPVLTIVPAGPGQATISWTPATPGFVLQETLSLAPTNWVNSRSGTSNPVTVPATLPTKFYRLFKP